MRRPPIRAEVPAAAGAALAGRIVDAASAVPFMLGGSMLSVGGSLGGTALSRLNEHSRLSP